MPALGDTLMIPGWNGVPHMFVVVWGPGQIPQEATHDLVMMVCFDTIYPGIPHDASCVLQPGEHVFITDATYVSYRHLRCDVATHVDQMIAQGLWQAKTPVSATVLKRMRAGLCKSKAPKPRYKQAMGCPPPVGP